MGPRTGPIWVGLALERGLGGDSESRFRVKVQKLPRLATWTVFFGQLGFRSLV